MPIIEIGNKGAAAHLNYSIVVAQAHKEAPTKILVPNGTDYRELFRFLHESGNGKPGIKFLLRPDEIYAFHRLQGQFNGLIAVTMPLIPYENKSTLLLEVDEHGLISEANNLYIASK